MSLAVKSLIGLIALFLVAQTTTFVFGVRNEKFYAPFHFGAGVFLGIIFFGLLGSPFQTIVLTIFLGILWEIYEEVMWKFFLKKRIFKPQRQDTVNDLFLDFLGSVFGIFILRGL